MMRSEVTWAAASRRAGAFFGLPRGEARLSLGYEELRLFSKGVQVVAPSQQAEFFAAPSADADAPPPAEEEEEEAPPLPAAAAASELPTASFLPFNAAGLQCVLAEGCLYGWHLWGAETAASKGLGDAAARALMTPPERPPS